MVFPECCYILGCCTHLVLHVSAEFFDHIRTWNYIFSLYFAEVTSLVLSFLVIYWSRGGSSFYVRWGFTSSKVGVHIE